MEELEIKKLKIKNTILLILIVLLILALGALSYYTFFMKNKELNNINNEKIEKENKASEVKEEVTNGKFSQKEIDEVLYNFPYEKLLHIRDVDKTNLTEEEMLYIGYKGLSEGDKLSTSVEACDLSENSEVVKCMLHNMGLSDDMVDMANTKLWDNILGGSTKFELIPKDIMLQAIKSKMDKEYIFKDSFVKTTQAVCGSATFIYDKKIDMITVKFDGGCAGYPNAIKIIDGYKDEDNYVINMVKGSLELFDDAVTQHYKLYSESKPYVIIKDYISKDSEKENLEALVLQYRDKLDNYTLTFKKVGDNYQFVSVDYKG